ncbi:Mitotic-spindle organizing gamma-tubulin ring associated domain containing protein [Rhypophila sp. PSN 637]
MRPNRGARAAPHDTSQSQPCSEAQDRDETTATIDLSETKRKQHLQNPQLVYSQGSFKRIAAMPSDERSEKQAAAQQAVDILHEISTILNCHLDRRTLSICISMIENGVNPEALATAVKELRGEAQQTQIEAASSANAPAPRRR